MVYVLPIASRPRERNLSMPKHVRQSLRADIIVILPLKMSIFITHKNAKYTNAVVVYQNVPLLNNIF